MFLKLFSPKLIIKELRSGSSKRRDGVWLQGRHWSSIYRLL